jgi:hypothetical protein
VHSIEPCRLDATILAQWQAARARKAAALYMETQCVECGATMLRLRSGMCSSKTGHRFCEQHSHLALSKAREGAVAARRARVQELAAAGWTDGAMATELQVSRSLIRLDRKALNLPARPLGHPRKHPAPTERRCEGCGERFTPRDASQVARGDGRYCTPACARGSEQERRLRHAAAIARHRVAKERVDRIRTAEDTMTTSAVAADLKISPNTVLAYIKAGEIPAELRQIEAERIYFVRRADFARFKKEQWPQLRAAAMAFYEERGFYPPAWTRRSQLRWQGRQGGAKGGPAGIEAGRAKGGRPPISTPEQQQEMLRLDREGLSKRVIAERVFGASRYKDRVARFLNR